MLLQSLFTFILLACASANFFDFFQQQHQQQPQEPVSVEDRILLSDCKKYLCPDTLLCADSPNKCPCPMPASQLRCVLPNSDYVCISRPSGPFGSKYDNPKNNWKVDAKDDNVRDCGWVSRAWKGEN